MVVLWSIFPSCVTHSTNMHLSREFQRLGSHLSRLHLTLMRTVAHHYLPGVPIQVLRGLYVSCFSFPPFILFCLVCYFVCLSVCLFVCFTTFYVTIFVFDPLLSVLWIELVIYFCTVRNHEGLWIEKQVQRLLSFFKLTLFATTIRGKFSYFSKRISSQSLHSSTGDRLVKK